MCKKRNIKTGLILVVIVIVLFVFVCMIWHRASYAIFANLFTKKISLSKEDTWEGGRTYLGVAYADVSTSDYVDIYVPEGIDNPPLLIIVHGGGFITNDACSRQSRLMYHYFREHGYACASVNYRLADEAAYPAAIEDVKAAIRFLKANAVVYGYDATHVAIFGESAGGYLASMAALTNDEIFSGVSYIKEEEGRAISSRVDVLIDYYGAVEMRDFDADWQVLSYPKIVIDIANAWLDIEDTGFSTAHDYWIRKHIDTLSKEERASFDVITYARAYLKIEKNISIWIAHGDVDLTVPVLVSDRFYQELEELLGSEQVVYHRQHGAGHASDNMYTEVELAKIKAFMDKAFNLD